MHYTNYILLVVSYHIEKLYKWKIIHKLLLYVLKAKGEICTEESSMPEALRNQCPASWSAITLSSWPLVVLES